MIGTWLTNLICALIGFLLIMFVSLPQNTLETSAIRGLNASILLFLVTYFIRWIIPTVFNSNNSEEDKENSLDDVSSDHTEATEERVESGQDTQQTFQPFGENDYDEIDPIKQTSEYVKSLIHDEQ
ncbi:hypothetical protein [Bacillus solimangrovi]|uniref:Uncharacterized protein n=1 Tax=Bacillus solimangrovi TaxID=1305675 RepID=A0A1E5LB32_9BACI|nr:hypothetical protein [Bacillus solimangrovi]OEH91285.1 hypothetical protein BFG57_06610 [Bacillus solimangrovi]